MVNIARFKSNDDVFDNMFRGFLMRPVPFEEQPEIQIKIDVKENDKNYTVHAEIPGVKKEDITISVENGWLTLKGERNPNPAAEIKRVLHREIEPHAFARTIRLPHVVDVNAISAELENGLLRITLPKADEVRPRTIAVK